LFGTLFLLIPFCVLIIVSSGPFVGNAFAMGEGSPDPGGLPYRFLLKAAIPVGFALLILQGVAQMLRALMTITATLTSPSANRPTDASRANTDSEGQ
jgi:TRAP-type mannitol/chloroaromatic compound transport system permease small subunit